MATTCPICSKGKLKKGDKFVYCSERKAVKLHDGSFKEEGCKFKIFYDQKKIFGDVLTPGDVKKLVEGETLTSSKGHKMVLDKENEFFTKIEFAPKEEDEDL